MTEVVVTAGKEWWDEKVVAVFDCVERSVTGLDGLSPMAGDFRWGCGGETYGLAICGNIEFSAWDKCEGDNREGFEITLDGVDISDAFEVGKRLIGRLG